MVNQAQGLQPLGLRSQQIQFRLCLILCPSSRQINETPAGPGRIARGRGLFLFLIVGAGRRFARGRQLPRLPAIAVAILGRVFFAVGLADSSGSIRLGIVLYAALLDGRFALARSVSGPCDWAKGAPAALVGELIGPTSIVFTVVVCRRSAELVASPAGSAFAPLAACLPEWTAAPR